MPELDDILELEKQLDPAARALVSMMRVAFEQLTKQLEDLKAQNAELRRMLFGRSSEKIPPIDSEVRRVVEEEELLGSVDDSSRRGDEADEDEESRKAALEKARRQRGRKRSEKARADRRLAKKKLPVIHERVTVRADQLPEGYELDDFRPVGEGEVIRRIEHVREHLVIVEYVLERLASRDGEHIISAEAPPAVVEGGQYGPGVYAHVAVAKCDDSLPLYRIEKGFARDGFTIPRSTLCGLFHRAAELLEPISARLLELARTDPYLSADETTMPVQQAGGCRDGWVWTFISPMVIAYLFTEGRGGKVPENLLEDTEGYLQVDGYKGYDSSCTDKGRERVGCWAHVRRTFFKALSTAPEARQVLDLIVGLYRVEYEAAAEDLLCTPAHLELRQRKSKKILAKLEKLLAREKPKHLPEGPMGKAITYAQNQWATLEVFLTDPKLRLDNNLSENALRIMALGRKNFLFVGHDVAGANLATLQTVVATCKLHGLNPHEYIRDVLVRVQTHPASKIDELLPFNWNGPQAQGPPAS